MLAVLLFEINILADAVVLAVPLADNDGAVGNVVAVVLLEEALSLLALFVFTQVIVYVVFAANPVNEVSTPVASAAVLDGVFATG